MRFYVSWSRSDPFYPLYDSNASMLISIATTTSVWAVDRLPVLPKFLMIDSGGYSLARLSDEVAAPKSVFKRQLSMLGESNIPTIFCPLDYPIADAGLSEIKKDKLITETIANAYELKKLIEVEQVASNISAMGIIQGDSTDALKYCARELKNISFPIYGIGSLAGLYDHKAIAGRIEAVASVIPPQQLHVFGVSALESVRFMNEIGIASFDSARPIKAAIYNTLLYSDPFQIYYIEYPSRLVDREIAKSRVLQEAIPCECPICVKDPEAIFGVGSSKHTKKRAVHNYFHLKREFLNEARS